MNKLEINEKIALLLGFEKQEYMSGHQWIYPPQFQYMQAGVPAWYCPDFLKIIENYHQIQEMTNYGTPKAYTFDTTQQETL